MSCGYTHYTATSTRNHGRRIGQNSHSSRTSGPPPYPRKIAPARRRVGRRRQSAQASSRTALSRKAVRTRARLARILDVSCRSRPEVTRINFRAHSSGELVVGLHLAGPHCLHSTRGASRYAAGRGHRARAHRRPIHAGVNVVRQPLHDPDRLCGRPPFKRNTARDKSSTFYTSTATPPAFQGRRSAAAVRRRRTHRAAPRGLRGLRSARAGRPAAP